MITGAEFLITLFLFPVAAIIGGLLGRKIQRMIWMSDYPYEERVKAFCKGK